MTDEKDKSDRVKVTMYRGPFRIEVDTSMGPGGEMDGAQAFVSIVNEDGTARAVELVVRDMGPAYALDGEGDLDHLQVQVLAAEAVPSLFRAAQPLAVLARIKHDITEGLAALGKGLH